MIVFATNRPYTATAIEELLAKRLNTDRPWRLEANRPHVLHRRHRKLIDTRRQVCERQRRLSLDMIHCGVQLVRGGTRLALPPTRNQLLFLIPRNLTKQSDALYNIDQDLRSAEFQVGTVETIEDLVQSVPEPPPLISPSYLHDLAKSVEITLCVDGTFQNQSFTYYRRVQLSSLSSFVG